MILFGPRWVDSVCPAGRFFGGVGMMTGTGKKRRIPGVKRKNKAEEIGPAALHGKRPEALRMKGKRSVPKIGTDLGFYFPTAFRIIRMIFSLSL